MTDYYELFGVEPEAGTAAEGRESDGGNATQKETAESGADTGEKSPEVTEPERTAEEGNQSKKSADDAEKTVQTKEERARYAAARRKAERERDEAIERVRKEEAEKRKSSIEKLLKTVNLQNPYTGEAVETEEQFTAYAEKYNAEQVEEFKRQNNMSNEQFEAFLQSTPQMQEAARTSEEAKRALFTIRQQELRERVDAQIREITQLDPTIQSVRDLAEKEYYPDLYELVQKGYSISDAYKLTNFDALQKAGIDAAKQQTRNAVNSKAHLTKTTTRGEGSVEVPPDIKAEYRALNPDATDAEIQQHYAKYATPGN